MIHMGYIYNAFMYLLKHQTFGCVDFQWKDRNLSGFIKNIIISVLKMNETSRGWLIHETIFIFGWGL